MLQNYFEKSNFLKNNKMKKYAYRSYIQVRYNLGKTSEEYCDLKIHARSCSPSLSTIQRWFNRFRNGEKNLQDKQRSGRPITTITQTNTCVVRAFIKGNPYCSYDEIEAEIQLSRGLIFNIIHESLKMKKITSRWVAHELTQKNKS